MVIFGCHHLFFSDEQTKLEQRRQWLDSEVEKVLKRKEAIEALEEELKKREAIIVKKEAMLTEKSELEMKKLRSSQVLTKVKRWHHFCSCMRNTSALYFTSYQSYVHFIQSVCWFKLTLSILSRFS